MTTEMSNAREGGFGAFRAPMVGRLAEREAIVAAVRRAAQDSRPRLVTVVGGPGIGKSRLVAEVLADLAERAPDVRAYRGACRPETGLLGAVSRILRSRLGLSDGLDAERQRAEIRARVAELFGERRAGEIMHFLGAFLGLELREGAALADTFEENSRAFQEVARAVLRRFFEVDAQRSPLLLVIEDLHLARPESVKLMRELVESMREAPVIVLSTARPELYAAAREWGSALRDRHDRVDLAPLAPAESEALARALLGRVAEVPGELVDAAVEMGGGNPQLIEHLVALFFGQGVVTVNDDGSASVDLARLDDISIPLSVEDAVRQRLAALAPAERETLEMAAVMGPVFWLGGLVVLGRAGKDAPEIWGGGEDLAPHFRDVLHALEARDFVLRMPDSAIAGDEEYVFKHNLERATLEKLVAREVAADWHQLLAEWLEFRLPDRTEEHLDLLARHYERGNRPLRAARCYLESADRARARYANAKAVEHYQAGLALLGEHDVRLRLDAHHHLGDVLQLLGRSDEALVEFRAMLALAFRLDLRAKGGAAHNRIGRVHRDTGHLDLAMRHLGTGLALFEAAGDERGVASSYDDIGKVHWMRGNYDQALRYLQDALARREALGDARSIALSLNNIGLVFQDSGQYKAAHDALTRALWIRRDVDDLQGVCATLNNLGTIHQDKGEDAEAIRLWQEALAVAREVGDRKRQAVLLLNIGEAQYRLRNPDEAIEILMEVEQLCVELGDRILLAESWRGLGKAVLLRGEVPNAQRYLERAVELFEQTRSRVHTAIAKRSLAECLATYGFESEQGRRSEQLFRDALDVFEDTGAELEYARSARAFAELLRQAPEAAGPDLLEEANVLARRAEEIFDKLRASGAMAEPPSLFDDGDRPSSPGAQSIDDAFDTAAFASLFDDGVVSSAPRPASLDARAPREH